MLTRTKPLLKFEDKNKDEEKPQDQAIEEVTIEESTPMPRQKKFTN